MTKETQQRNSNVISMNNKLNQKKPSTPVFKSYYLSKTGEIIFSTPNDTAEHKAQQAKEEVEQGETVVKVTTQNR